MKKLEILTIAGLIMVFVPVNSVIIMLLYTAFRKIESVPGSFLDSLHTMYQTHVPSGLAVVTAVVFLCGLGILAYVGFRKKRGKIRTE
ncbi:MAG: hypothetical protein JW712_08095 [Dehalococcoidales bacterium]|nr:hypothetical protein [Dehalococcoidales bacterium]